MITKDYGYFPNFLYLIIYFNSMRLLHLILFTGLPLSLMAQQISQTQSMSVSTDYWLYLPQQYHTDTTTSWPLLIFLHGAGERGDDLEKVKTHGPPKLVEEQDFPFIIVSPQCPAGEWWSIYVLNKLFDEIVSGYRVDEYRVYLTGLSMGGFGTWEWVAENPEKFAAIAPVCGGGDPALAWRFRNIPAWIFHGEQDRVVPAKFSQDMAEALKSVGADPQLTLYPEAGHDSWTETYNNSRLYEWFLSHKRVIDPSTALKNKQYMQYVGDYLDAYGDTIRVIYKEGDLTLTYGFMTRTLTPESDHTFYMGRWYDNHVFIKDEELEMNMRFLSLKAQKINE